MTAEKPTLMLLDGNSLAFRAFYALPAENFKTRSGLTTNAVYGFTAMLINVSRAANVDEEALLAALETGKLGSAALDVFEGEPAFNPRFLALPNVLLQPHHASGTIETRKAMGQLVRDNLTAHFAGQELPTPVI